MRIASDTGGVRRVLVCLALVACGDDGGGVIVNDSGTPDEFVACPRNRTGVCNPLTQAGCPAGEKCTWILNALEPQYVGHIGCVPDGTAAVGEACRYGPPGCDGYDNCREGAVCSDFQGGEGICKQICDQQGGFPECDAQHTCVVYSGLFTTGETTPAAAGVCDLACNPLTDNDFDGSGTASTKTTSACGSDPTIGCYGYPSFGTYPQTTWSCTSEANPTLALRHRAPCTQANGCAAPTPFVNSCSQGYLPLLFETTNSSTVICVAMCKPKNCYAGNCGTNNDNRLGEAPHRCTTPDRAGTFDTSPGGEHCRYLWSFEIDQQGSYLPSPTSNAVGFCFDHSKYLYDTNSDNVPDTVLPACASLPDGFATSSPYDGAADLGCVDTTHANLAHGKRIAPALDVRVLTTRTAK
jgi:hypothetical protein